jgi:NAD(P)-dependent dehydrogenase (short-subunit alcohol dehydrogenase family)
VFEDPELNNRSNIHILAADITDYAALQVIAPHIASNTNTNTSYQTAVSETAKLTGGSLDYIIANAGLITPFDQYDGIGDLYAPLPSTRTATDASIVRTNPNN